MVRYFVIGLALALTAWTQDLESARDRQDRGALDHAVAELSAKAGKQPNDAEAQYKLALAESYIAEVATEIHDKNQAKSAAENGMKAAERAVSLKPDSAEYHRILGTLCGQYIPAAGVLAGMKYGRCATDEVNKAIQLDPNSARAYVSRGVGNYYLPSAFGGGVDLAIKDFEKAIELNPKSSEAYLWLGIAQRKLNRNAEARKAFQKSLELDPHRVWTQQQLEKTPSASTEK
ncbi:MAG TPA: tetratricopeptide repeat protein [Bryobacteraceae bacterium]|nr:tetratricopeptide repeat protein [Bryobacteraceae bacterium]